MKYESNNKTASSSRQYHAGSLIFGSTRTVIRKRSLCLPHKRDRWPAAGWKQYSTESEHLIQTPKEYVLKVIEMSAMYSLLLRWNVIVEEKVRVQLCFSPLLRCYYQVFHCHCRYHYHRYPDHHDYHCYCFNVNHCSYPDLPDIQDIMVLRALQDHLDYPVFRALVGHLGSMVSRAHLDSGLVPVFLRLYPAPVWQQTQSPNKKLQRRNQM